MKQGCLRSDLIRPIRLGGGDWDLGNVLVSCRDAQILGDG